MNDRRRAQVELDAFGNTTDDYVWQFRDTKARRMHAFSAILLIVQLLAHSVGGCCWHHEHAADRHGAAGASNAASSATTCCPHREAAAIANTHDCPHAPADEAPCEQSKCVLGIARNRADIEIPNQALYFVVSTDTCPRINDLRAATRQASVVEDVEPPLRLHALHRVLLI